MENLKKASELYFRLLEQKVINDEEECFHYFFESEVRDHLLVLLDESNTRIVEAEKRLHLVTKPEGSTFATHFTHMKSKYSEMESKKRFNLITIIIMTYLAEVDRSSVVQVKSSREGLTYHYLHSKVQKLVDHWIRQLDDNPNFGVEEGLALKEIIEEWTNMEVTHDRESHRPNKRTRIGLIRSAMKLLENEGLVYIADKEQIVEIFARQELFERLEYLYHHQERYQLIKEMIEQGRNS
ncbi:DUF6063 family protein [Halalkalibacillus sediminis]|nr:DUF6063 family protein [Halalkalibacillus sediminis]